MSATTYAVCPQCGYLNEPSAGRCRAKFVHRLEGAQQVTLARKLSMWEKQKYVAAAPLVGGTLRDAGSLSD